MHSNFTENDLENAIIDGLCQMGYSYANQTDNWTIQRLLSDFINDSLLLEQLQIINPKIDVPILKQAIARLKNLDNPSLFERNHIEIGRAHV